MIYTSYYQNYRNFLVHRRNYGFKIQQISLWAPKWPCEWLDDSVLELAPTVELLMAAKNKKITNRQYDEIFKQGLANLDPEVIYNKCKNSVLLCYETPQEHCHRHLVREWLNDNDIDCEELENPSVKEKKERE